MRVNEFGVKEKTKRVNQSPVFISNTFNKFFDVLTNKFPKQFFFCHVMNWSQNWAYARVNLTFYNSL